MRNPEKININTKTAVKKIYLFLLLIVLSVSLNCQDTVFVDAGITIGPALQRGIGFLEGYSDPVTLPDSLLLPIRCRFQRAGVDVIMACYNRNRSMGCSMEVILGFIDFDRNPRWDKSVLPGANGNWQPWEDYISGVVKEFKSKGMAEDISFSIWDNPDRDHGFWPSDEHYFEAWCRAQRQVKKIIPSAKMVGPNSTHGPNTDWWPEHSGDNTWYIYQFLDYTIAQGCIPDIIARHDHYTDGKYIESDAAALLKYCTDKGIDPIPFEQDDVGARFTGGPEQFAPGHFVSLFASIERAKILRTCKCCWDRDCITNSLNGLVTKDTRQKRSLWWTYKAYADIKGHILSFRGSADVDGVAGWDSTNDSLRMIVGRNAATGGQVTVVVHNLKNKANATITGCSIPDSKADPAPRPVQTLKRTMPVKDGNLTFSIPDLGEYGAYSIEISGIRPVSGHSNR